MLTAAAEEGSGRVATASNQEPGAEVVMVVDGGDGDGMRLMGDGC